MGLSKCAMNKLGRNVPQHHRREERVSLWSIPRVLDNRIVSDVRGTITIDGATRRVEGIAAVVLRGYWQVDKKLSKCIS